MKICIVGYSGAGKSTLSKILCKHYNIPVLHLDSVHFLPGWKERSNEDMNEIVLKFMEENDSWIIEGNYYRIGNHRFDVADKLFFLNYNRFVCIRQAIKRAKIYKNKTREDMAEGCPEKMDLEFASWILLKGRTKRIKLGHLDKMAKVKDSVMFKNRKQLLKYLKDNNIKTD